MNNIKGTDSTLDYLFPFNGVQYFISDAIISILMFIKSIENRFNVS